MYNQLNKIKGLLWTGGAVPTFSSRMTNLVLVHKSATGCQGIIVIYQPLRILQSLYIILLFVLSVYKFVSSATSTLSFSKVVFFKNFLSPLKYVSKRELGFLRPRASLVLSGISRREFSSKSYSDNILLELTEELRSCNIKAHASAQDEIFPTDSSYDIIQPFGKFIHRMNVLSQAIITLNAKYGIDVDSARPEGYREELRSVITDASLNLESIRDVMDTLTYVKTVRISDGVEYSFTDYDTVLSHERTLFLINLVSMKFRNTKFPGVLESLDQLKAFIRTDSEIAGYFNEVKCIYDFCMTLDPVLFSAGITPSEFKAFLEDKKAMGKINVIKQATYKELASNTKTAKKALIAADSNLFEQTSWVYKFMKLSREMIPHDLNSRIIMSYPRVDEMELAYNRALSSLRKYCIHLYKNPQLVLSKVLTKESIDALLGFRFDDTSFEEYKELLKGWSSSKSTHGSK